MQEEQFTEQILPLAQAFSEKCKELGIIYRWQCQVDDELFSEDWDGQKQVSQRGPLRSE